MFAVASALTISIKNRTSETLTNLIFLLNANESRGRKIRKLRGNSIDSFGFDLSQIRNSYGTLTMSYDYNNETHTIILNENQSGFYAPRKDDCKRNLLVEILDINHSGELKVNIDKNYIPS